MYINFYKYIHIIIYAVCPWNPQSGGRISAGYSQNIRPPPDIRPLEEVFRDVKDGSKGDNAK